MWTLNKKVKSLIVCVLMMILFLPTDTYAMESLDSINSSESASLTISFLPEENPAAGVEFRLYQVAELSGDDEYMVTPAFAEYPVIIPGADAETNRQLATTLPAYIAADGIEADYAGTTNEEGKVSFEEMDTGMYMVMGDTMQEKEEYVLPTPFMLELTSSVATSCKFMSRYKTETVAIEVMKVWKDDDYSGRPQEVEVELYGGNTLYDTVTLSKENNWRYEWTGLDSGLFWSTREVDVPDGYSVSVEQQGNRYVVNNSRYTPPTETQPPEGTIPPEGTASPEDTTPPEGTASPEDTTPPEGTASPEDTTPPKGTMPPEGTTPPKATSSPVKTPAPAKTAPPAATNAPVITPSPTPIVPTLPQTSMLWWPVPVLLAAGVLLIMVGLLRRRGGKDEE